ncbi:putative arylsulfatase precursor [Cutaneotrichosporon oleaginosum]|uniref:Putative arylsulfatase n=1 Tax=Cutaneotrichosporon oleaginosum TaxID=879819 RepID=A0A0J0XRQ9_9TREE|nr:putative arylsulfatase precursor [Cutaneotrichosporon oleaginosum]KLT43770.1 putative arylsulfatase precursor [Cutaneotrichosporon oleaginosum]
MHHTLMLALLLLTLAAASASAAPKKPNIVLILTDDQDSGTLHRRFLPHTFSALIDHGLSLPNFFTPVSLCCPARVSLLRAQHAHNHNVTFVSAPWGGWDVFNARGYVGHTLPDFLQRAGYATFYTGKYMNAHTEENCESMPVSGFTSSDILVDPYTYDYWNPGFSRDNGPVTVHRGEYSTDLVRDKALGYLEDGLAGNEPFFLGIAPIGPHSWIPHDSPHSPTGVVMHVPAAHPRHANLFGTEQLPRSASWNPAKPHGVSWVRTLPRLTATQEAYLDEFHRGRLRALAAVDEMVGAVVQRLERAGALDNTYIFYTCAFRDGGAETADNGYAMGTHRRQPGKTLAFEEDMRVPFVVRGPGVRKGTGDASYGIVDLARTIMDIAGAQADYVDDGARMDIHGHHEARDAKDASDDNASDARHARHARHALAEYWVLGVEEGIYGGPWRTNNTYRTLRISDTVHSRKTSLSYAVWCTGERELYDLEADPLQTANLLAGLNARGPFADFALLGAESAALLARLDALLLVLKTCVGDTCRRPWSALLPRAQTLQDALAAQYDAYFAALPRVRYAGCALGYRAEMEQPEWDGAWAYVPPLVVQP